MTALFSFIAILINNSNESHGKRKTWNEQNEMYKKRGTMETNVTKRKHKMKINSICK